MNQDKKYVSLYARPVEGKPIKLVKLTPIDATAEAKKLLEAGVKDVRVYTPAGGWAASLREGEADKVVFTRFLRSV